MLPMAITVLGCYCMYSTCELAYDDTSDTTMKDVQYMSYLISMSDRKLSNPTCNNKRPRTRSNLAFCCMKVSCPGCRPGCGAS